MTKRSTRQQTKHDRGVQKSAEFYEKQGFKVAADIKDYSKPNSINGRRPDVIATKGKREIIVEVETKDSIGKDKGQQQTFQTYADKHNNTRFRTKVV
jgi:hypothetical protein